MRARFSIYLLILFIFYTSVHAESHHPQEFLTQIRGSKNEGMQIYQHFCANCHAQKPLIQLGAPRFGVQGDWNTRLKQGLQVLLLHTDEGFNAMPPRGGCFECSDEQLILAIISMVPNSEKKVLINQLNAYKKNSKSK